MAMNGKDTDLVSVLVLSYNNGDLIFDTLTSIINQTYPHIEIIVSDDHSECFDRERVITWLTEHSGSNIERFVVNVNDTNQGTVRNAENALAMAKGNIITQIAADDEYYSPTVFEIFVGHLNELGEDARFITGQTRMMDAELKKVLYDFVSESDKKTIMESDPSELFERSSSRCFIPACSFWRNGLQDTIGPLSDRYRLIDDYTKTLRMSRMGVRIHYLDENLMNHRDGGVSHGNRKGSNETYRLYLKDFVETYRHEIIPYMDEFSPKTVEEVLRTYSMWLRKYENASDGNENGSDNLLTRAVKAVLLRIIDVSNRIYDAVSSKNR